MVLKLIKAEAFFEDGALLFSYEKKVPAKKVYGCPPLAPVIADLKRIAELKRMAKDGDYDNLVDFLRAEKEMGDEC